MAIATVPNPELSAGPDFPGLFRRYIAKSVQITLAGIPQDAAVLTEEGRERALHVLSFALKMEDVWSTTRDLLLLLAPKLEQAGYRDDWLPYLEVGIELSQRCGDQLAEAKLRWHVGRLSYLCSRFNVAGQQLTISLRLFHILDDTRGQARAYNTLAWLHYLQHRYAEATHDVEQALALLHDADPERAISYLTQGMIAFDQEWWQEAEELHRKALLLFEKQGDRRRIAWSMQNLATVLRGQKRFEDAIIYYQQAVNMLNQMADIHNLGIVQMNLGSIYIQLNKPTEALTHYKQAELIFNGLYDRLSIAKINTGLGLGYFGLKKYTEAEIAFLSSARLFAELQDDSLRLNATDGLVMTYLANKQYDQAIKVAKQALRELPSIANAPNYNYLLQSLNQHLAEARQGQALAIK